MGKTDDKKQEKIVDKIKKSQFYNKWWFWVTVIAVPAVIICVVLIGGLNSQTNTVDTTSAETSSGSGATVEELEAKNVIGDDSEAVVQFSNGLTVGFFTGYTRPWQVYQNWAAPSSGKEYLSIYAGLMNNSTDENSEISYGALDFALYDKSGELVSVTHSAPTLDSEVEDMFLDEGVLKSGEKAIGIILFEIDKTQKMSDLQLQYGNLTDRSEQSKYKDTSDLVIQRAYFNF